MPYRGKLTSPFAFAWHSFTIYTLIFSLHSFIYFPLFAPIIRSSYFPFILSNGECRLIHHYSYCCFSIDFIHFDWFSVIKTSIFQLQPFVEEDGQIFTPLAVASRNGRYRVVKMLLSNFKPIIDQECTAKFDGHIVQGATALWCAASSGNWKLTNEFFFCPKI